MVKGMTRSAYQRSWRQANREKMKAYRREWARRNPAYMSAAQKRKRARNPEHTRQMDRKYAIRFRAQRMVYLKQWLAEHPGYREAVYKEQVAKCADWYVRARMSRGTSIKPADWPAELVELNRQNIKLKRLWKKQTDSKTSTT